MARAGWDRGFTLAEIAIAGLIVAIGTTAILSVVTTGKTQLKHSNVKDQMTQQSKRLIDDLRNYTRPATCTLAECTANGPNNGSWVYPNDTSGCWALNDGGCNPHNVSNILPAWLLAAPHNATLLYTVTDGGNKGRSVAISMSWNED